jgi:hypothetical protein
MHRELEMSDDEARELFGVLPRTSPLSHGETDRMVARLRREGLLRPVARPRRVRTYALQAAAALIIFAVGAWAGVRYARHGSLEDMLSRKSLSVADRILLLQRAGSAYVTAAQGYAAATAHVDSSAVEVASQVLLGAAHAVARTNLDGGLSERLNSVLAAPKVVPVSDRKQIIWF